MRGLPLLLALGLTIAATPARAGFTITYFGPSAWGTTDAALGVSGYTIENFEDTALAPGLLVARLNGGVGNFAATNTLPATSVFDPTTDPAAVIQAFLRGVWDGSNVLINNPGPGFSASPAAWYSDGSHWADLELTFPAQTVSVGFSLQQMEQSGNRLFVNGATLLVPDLTSALATLGTDIELYSGGSFISRNGYIRIDATGTDTIQTVLIDNGTSGPFGDGLAIDHLAFQVPEPASLGVLGLAAFGLGLVRRRVARAPD